jgi:hypothetical protein
MPYAIMRNKKVYATSAYNKSLTNASAKKSPCYDTCTSSSLSPKLMKSKAITPCIRDIVYNPRAGHCPKYKRYWEKHALQSQRRDPSIVERNVPYLDRVKGILMAIIVRWEILPLVVPPMLPLPPSGHNRNSCQRKKSHRGAFLVA